MTPRRPAAVPDRPQRVAFYVRVSSLMGRGGDDFHSPDVQTTAMQRVTRGMKVVEVIDDDIDQTGRTFDREGIAKIRALAEAKAIDAMAVYNISRFGRNVLEGLQFLSWLADRGVTILSATEHIDTSTPAGRWMLTNMLAIAEMRSDEIGAEWSRIISHRTAAGKPHGRIPAGYLRGEDGKLHPDPATGPAVTRAFVQYAAGVQAGVIRRELQAATGMALAGSTFRNLLRNRAYLGEVRSRGQLGPVEKAGSHEPLVDDETWRRVQSRLEIGRREPPRVVEPQYALTGLARCGLCSGAANHKPDRRRGGVTIRIYCGRQYGVIAPHCTGCGYTPAEAVESEVLSRITKYIAHLRGDVGAQAAQAARAGRAGADAATVESELAANRRAMARATERWAKQQLDDQTYDDAMASLQRADADLKLRLAGLQEEASRPEPGKIVELGEKLIALWGRMDGPQRNWALRELVERVEIMPSGRYRQPAKERIEVHWR